MSNFTPSATVISQSQAYWAGILTALQQGGPIIPGSTAAQTVLGQVQVGLAAAQQEVLAIDYQLSLAIAAGLGALTATQMISALQAAADLTVQEATLKNGIGYLERIQTNLIG